MIKWLRLLDIFFPSSSTQKENTEEKSEASNDYGKETSIDSDVLRIIRREILLEQLSF